MKDSMDADQGLLHDSRLAALRREIERIGAEALLVFCLEGKNWENIFFLCGFRGTHSALLVDRQRALLITDGRYLKQAKEQTSIEVADQGNEGLFLSAKRTLNEWGIRKAALEYRRIPHSLALAICEKSSIDWFDGSAAVEGLRRRKNGSEAQCIATAGEICAAALNEVLSFMKPGVTEREIAARLEFAIRMNGAESAWGDHEFIVASGSRSVLPHGIPTEKRLEDGEWVTLDFGARVGGYLCDVTRNVAIGHVPEKARELHKLLEKAQEEAFRQVRPGRKACEVDGVARELIRDAGYGDAFTHGLGHGLGLELHEMPRVSRFSEEVLEMGDVITIEPGVYLSDFGGLRLEDDCLVTEHGGAWLTRALPSSFLQVP